ncbi:hypothetical protein ACFXBB_36310 [Streptomyces scopuliridis]|uniref:hypothetical protein n=1 Tax=Streptomyces scopuliridis TaxID=452529 RepID=UPI00368E6FB7
MGTKPSTAAQIADIASEPSLGSEISSRFGMPHAFVIVAFVVTAAVLAKLGMNAQNVLILIGGAGAMGATVVLVVVTGSRSGGRLSRFLRAYLSSGN